MISCKNMNWKKNWLTDDKTQSALRYDSVRSFNQDFMKRKELLQLQEALISQTFSASYNTVSVITLSESHSILQT